MAIERLIMEGVREYGEGDPVGLYINKEKRYCIHATNEAGNNATSVDLLDILIWIKLHQPTLFLRADEACPKCCASGKLAPGGVLPRLSA